MRGKSSLGKERTNERTGFLSPRSKENTCMKIDKVFRFPPCEPSFLVFQLVLLPSLSLAAPPKSVVKGNF